MRGRYTSGPSWRDNMMHSFTTDGLRVIEGGSPAVEGIPLPSWEDCMHAAFTPDGLKITGLHNYGMLVGFITNGSTLPTKRPDDTDLQVEDYVRPTSTSTFPFTVTNVGGDTITINDIRDQLYWTGHEWSLFPGMVPTTSEIAVVDKAAESYSGTSINQKEINTEVTTKLKNHDAAIALKANAADVYTKEETDDLLDDKQDGLTAGFGILMSDNTISVDDVTVSSVDYVDANITDTMNFIIQERDTEQAARIAGDNLINTKIGDLEDLETEDKSSVVAAVNEAASAGGVKKVSTPPTESTAGELGDMVVCNTASKVAVYVCTAADTSTSAYTWQRLAFMNEIQLLLNNNALGVQTTVDTSNNTLDSSETTAELDTTNHTLNV